MKDLPISGAQPRLLFEVSWEVANKVGGIHTVLIGKAPLLYQQWGASYLPIGPYLASSTHEWEEAPSLFADWREYVLREKGYAIHGGYWHAGEHRIPSLLIDFYPALSRRNTIFAELWETYQVDSLLAEWDYIEPAIFGFIAGEAIASFCEFYYGDIEAIAHFHEWLTGAGVLYLRKYAPSIVTLFTTHATVAGRAAGGQLIPQAEVSEWVRSRGLLSKHTLERAAWQYADATTTVSEIISQEAAHYLGHAADVITPNGWMAPTSLPTQAARTWLDQLKEHWEVTTPIFWLLHAGRAELENKGTTTLIQALHRYRSAPVSGLHLGVIFAVPGASERPAGPPTGPLWVTHTLRHPEQDVLLALLRSLSLSPKDPLRIVYMPVYLEGEDGVLNLPYYALLSAVDASAFPSRYEPWGYTPQESLGVGVPTLSTRQSGFGRWMLSHLKPLSDALSLIDYQASDPPGQLLSWLYRRLQSTPAEREQLRREALTLAGYTRWPQFLSFYQQAYAVARTKAQARRFYQLTPQPTLPEQRFVWHRAFFTPTLPDILRPLQQLAYNLWWSWNADAQSLFASIDPIRWEEHENPVWLLNHLPNTTWRSLSQQEEFLRQLRQVSQRFQGYMAQPLRTDAPLVAYLCMEYGIARCLPFYSGGLGVLAGDYLKEASDKGYPLIAIGLLYRKGYFTQRISAEGEQIAEHTPLRFTDLPLEPVRQQEGRWLRLRIPIGNNTLYLKVWRAHVGRIPLYLLDADVSENPPDVRAITAQLYPGESELRLLQEIALGFGAQALIEALALPVEIFHYNEGHPAFHLLAHLHHHIQKGASLPAAQELVRAATLFTTHTPVPAGHDAFPPELLRRYIGGFVVQQLNLRWEEFLRWGEMPDQPDRFSLTAFCLRFAARTNAVSQLHTKVSQRMFAGLYPSYLPAEVPIDGVTNGVHVSTWQAPEWQRSKRSWETHQTLKTHLLNFLKRRLSGHPWPVAYLRSVQAFFASTDENTLLLGFARRFATYKRHLLLLQSEEFSELLSAQPVRLIIAGKAHPQDEAGKAALREAWRKTLQPPLLGKVLFIPDYDMHIARLLVQGVDVWVNLPVYGQEASGTSGMKACLNGVLHFSLPDGWWAEVPAEEAGGWAIPPCQTAEAAIRDAWEATQAVYLLQESVLPAYQSRDAKGLPTEWIHRMEKAQRYAKEHFSTQRMLREYEENLYSPLSARLHKLKADPARFKERLSLLEQIDEAWSHLTIRRVWMPPFVERSQPAGTPFSVGVEVESTDIPAEALRAEIVFQPARGTPYTFPLPQVAPQTYAGEIVLPDPGVYHYAIRLYAWDPYLEERLWAWAKLL